MDKHRNINKFLWHDVTCRHCSDSTHVKTRMWKNSRGTMATVIIMASAIQTRIIQRIGKLTINWKFLVFCFNRKVYYFSISSNNDSRMSTPGIQMASNTPACYFDRNSSLSSNPDGLSHAVNQENLRLHQIVHEYKVRYLCVFGIVKRTNKTYSFSYCIRK